MKICMTTTSFPRYEDDLAGIFLSELAQSLSSSIGVKVLTSMYKGTKNRETIGKVEVRRFRYFPFLQNVVYPKGMHLQLKNHLSARLIFPFFSFIYSLKTFIESRNCNVIHANWLLSYICALPTKFLLKKPIVLNERGGIFHKDVKKGSLLLRIIKFFLKYVDAVVLISNELKKDFLDLGVLNERIFVIHNGINTDIFKQDKSKREKIRKNLGVGENFVFTSVSHLIPRKRIDVLIKAFTLFQKENANARLFIVGDGPEIAALKKLAQIENLEESTTFFGWKTRKEVAELYNGSDCFVLTSESETGPNSILEAMTSNLPVITTKVGLTSEVVSEENGEFIEKNNVMDLYAKMKKVYTRKDEMFENAKKIIDLGFGWDRTAKEYIQVYERVLTQRRKKNQKS